ncbi:hypothetical protein FIBSPDRAFT_876632 [Athelia psychrophila]|uniref:Uncharacterized protein n=1 Tax=Athelia psychrophila TaxID=1759441 RepID=A0A167WPG7_9AGAM|nr:hypothetical protein FIBSPDRAFT_876632 [Fibularhizoctonia sp. CBS 109695]
MTSRGARTSLIEPIEYLLCTIGRQNPHSSGPEESFDLPARSYASYGHIMPCTLNFSATHAAGC